MQIMAFSVVEVDSTDEFMGGSMACDLLVFAEFIGEQILNFSKGAVGIRAFGVNSDGHSQSGRQHHYTHNAFGVDTFAVACNVNFAVGKAGRELGEFGSSTGVQPQFIAYYDIYCGHVLFLCGEYVEGR